jgi:hypothetical protein
VNDAVTDASGHFELHGMAKAERYYVTLTPPEGELFFTHGMIIPDNLGLAPINADLEMVRGIPLRGRVTDKVSGKPVEGYVGYFPLYTNPNARELTQYGYRPKWLVRLLRAAWAGLRRLPQRREELLFRLRRSAIVFQKARSFRQPKHLGHRLRRWWRTISAGRIPVP